MSANGALHDVSDGGDDISVTVPLIPAGSRLLPLPRLPKGSVVAMTAGMLANDIPALTAEQECEAFELAVAEEVAEEGVDSSETAC